MPRQNRFRYRLEGFDPTWHDLPPDRGDVTYTNLSPGRYRLHVRAANSDGVWNDAGASLALYVLPPWWGTMWFRLLAVGHLRRVRVGARPGHDPDREADEHEPAPEGDHAGVDGAAGAVARGLEHRDEGRQADAERHEDEVEEGGDAELQARELERAHLGSGTAAVGRRGPGFTEISWACMVPLWWRREFRQRR